MKLRTYLITLMAFSMNHAFRITFPYNKNQVQSKYNVDDLFLGIMDVLSFFMYALGACFHFKIIDRGNIKQTYLKNAIFAIISGCFFAYFSLFFDNQIFTDPTVDHLVKKIILVVNICIYGFNVFSVWPINLSLVSGYYKPQTDGAMIGLWGAGWQLGNIIGLLVSNFMIFSLNLRWQTTVLVFAIANLVCALMIYFFLQNPSHNNKSQLTKAKLQLQNQQMQLSSTLSQQFNKQENAGIKQNPKQPQSQLNQQAFLCYIKQLTQSKQLIVYLLINGITSTVFTFFLFWIPIYIVNIGYQNISGYLTLIFQVFAIIGSFFLGILFESHLKNVTQKQQQNLTQKIEYFVSQNISFIATGINMFVLLIWILIDRNIVSYAVMIAILGFFMGGLFNSMHSNDLFVYTKNDPLRTEMFAVVILISNYLITGLGFLILGYLIHYSHKIGSISSSQSQYKSMIQVSFFFTIIIFVLFILKKKYADENHKNSLKLDAKNM